MTRHDNTIFAGSWMFIGVSLIFTFMGYPELGYPTVIFAIILGAGGAYLYMRDKR